MALFEELAARLATASDPRDRARAAEELAGLDDPRVAPALAKALADADAAVRQRVEQLLSQFCCRDKTGHLQLLLAEAERVSEALAAEVERLRGDSPLEGEAAAVEPIGPPEGYEGPCALIRLAPARHDIQRASKLVARALRRPQFEVAREIRTTQGFLARDVPAAAAAALVGELHQAGTVAGAVPMESLPTPPALVRLREPRVGRDALRGVTVPSGESCEVDWHSVEVVVAARMEIELKKSSSDEDWSVFTRPIRSRGNGGAHEAGYQYLIDVIVREPPQRVRLGTHELDFATMQRRPSGFGKVARLARQLLRHLDHRRLNAGVRRLADRDDEEWDDITFLSPLGFEDYVTWVRVLLALGVPLPR